MIKAKFKNIGPVQSADLELGELTIIAGQNNTGKTYLVYTLYGFLSSLSAVVYEFGRAISPKVQEIANQIKQSGSASIDFMEYKTIRSLFVKRISSLFSSQFLHQVFSSPKKEFADARFSLGMNCKKSAVENSVSGRYKDHKVNIRSYLKNGKARFESDQQELSQVPLAFIEKGLIALFIKSIQRSLPEPFILSAERFGISLFYKELDFTKNRLVEELQKLSDKKSSDRNHLDLFMSLVGESARYARPIKDNIHFTRDLPEVQKQKSELPADKFHSVEKMMDGYYRAKRDEIRFISKRRGDKRFDIPLHLASSSARGVSDLYFYLKHHAQPGQILIVDEPESHLSPSNQILMARLLVFCVNAGLKVLISTHSDYLIKEINNLIMLHGNFAGKSNFLNSWKTDYKENDCLDPKRVKAYTCEHGRLQPCLVDETGIDMPVFDDAIDKINRASSELALYRDGSGNHSLLVK